MYTLTYTEQHVSEKQTPNTAQTPRQTEVRRPTRGPEEGNPVRDGGTPYRLLPQQRHEDTGLRSPTTCQSQERTPTRRGKASS